MNDWNSQDFVRLIYIIVAVIFPVFPAFILFKKLPSRAGVTGPYTGLNINLEGAFGGYFLLFLAILGFAKFGDSPPDYEHQVWKVNGRVILDQLNEPFDETKLSFSTRPNTTLSPEGDFTLYVVVRRERASEDFPFLIVEYGDEYQARTLNLNKLHTDNEPLITWTRKPTLKEIDMATPIVLKKKEVQSSEPEQEAQPILPGEN